MNEKQISTDDPRLTAFALGEMEPAERGEFEQLLQGDPAARRVVEEIRAAVPALTEALAGEPVPAAAEQPAAAPAGAKAGGPPPAGVAHERMPRVTPFPYYWVAGLAAACFAVGFVVWQAGYLKREQVRYVEIDLAQVASAEESQKKAVAEAEARARQAATATAEKDTAGQSVIEVGLRPEAKARANEGFTVQLPPMSVEPSPGKVAAASAPSATAAEPASFADRTAGVSVAAATGAVAIADGKTGASSGLRDQVLAERLPPIQEVPQIMQVAGPDPLKGQPLPPAVWAASAATRTASTPLAADAAAPGAAVGGGAQEETVKLEAFEVAGEKKGFFSRTLGRMARAVAPAKPEDRAVLNHAGQFPAEGPEPRGHRFDDRGFNTEAYDRITDNAFTAVEHEPLSTFSIDVDTAAYANLRRFLQGGQRPPRDAVRIEELVNYFPYDYAAATARDVPFSAAMEVASAPWTPAHRLVRIGLKGREVPLGERGPANLVFLLDVSGSMSAPNKLPLVQESMRLLVDKLRDDDRVAIVVYAGASGMALPSTPVAEKQAILEAIDRLNAGGSTNGAMGIRLAYDIAKANFVTGGINRIVLCTDGDFNVGVTNRGDLTRLVEEKAKTGVFLTVLGFGMGNLKDATLEQLADKGNGNYGYIDSRREAQKLLVEQAGGTLVTIAKDVKIQVEFNPAQVQAYRLIGYENRMLRKEDFNNDKIDAGEIGSGHTVTALYEVVPAGAEWKPDSGVDPLKYQVPAGRAKAPAAASGELLTLKLRYKAPDGDTSRLLEFPLRDTGAWFEDASPDFKFAASVAAFGMILRDSPHKGGATLAAVSQWANAGLGRDAGGYRNEFLGLVRQAESVVR